MLAAGSLLMVVLLGTAPAWALPSHGFDKNWGKTYGHDDKYEKHDGKWGDDYDNKSWFDKDPGWELKKYVNKYDDDHEKKWGKGYEKWDPDCDPPVSTPEPATLLLFGSMLAGLGAARRWRGRRLDQ
jgi:hypothetical protein